jgi:hypothetical protein
MNAQEFRQAVEEFPYGKRLPSAVYLLDMPEEEMPGVLRKVCDELRARLEIGPEFNLLKFHLDSPKICSHSPSIDTQLFSAVEGGSGVNKQRPEFMRIPADTSA